MALNALKIQTSDLVGKLVAQLSNRPTNPIGAGGDNLTAQEVKERYDAYGHLLKDRFNALVDALVADPSTDTDALANYIQVYLGDPTEDDPLSLADALAALVTAIAEKYALPDGGIPAEDLATTVQTSLGKADTAYQKPSGGIPAADLASAVKAILDSAVSQSEFAPVKALAENADKVLTAANYEAVATMLNAAAKTDYKVGQKILIGAGRVPDLWIYFVHDAAVSYTFTTNLAFQTALENGTLQIGYYALRPLEAKTELEGYATETYVGNAISSNIDATLSTTGKSADAKAVGDAIDALIEGLVEGIIKVAEADYAESATYAQQAGIASQINTDREIEDAETACPPVVFGTVGGNAEVQNGLMPFPEVHGYTIKWNQLADCANNTTDHESNVISSKLFNYHFSHKYLAIFDYEIESSVGNIYFLFGVWNSSQTSYRRQRINATGLKGRAAVIVNFDNISATDLTDGEKAKVILQRLGTDISASNKVSTSNIQFFDLTDNIYGAGNEPTSADVFVRAFPMPYYPYNAGTLLSSKSSSVDFVKRNQWDEEWELGKLNWDGSNMTSSTNIRSKNYVRVLGGETYYVKIAGARMEVFYYDANKTFISYEISSVANQTITVPSTACFLRFFARTEYGTTYKNDICIYVNWDTPGLPYVPYSKQTITLPNRELRSAGSAYDVLYQQGGGKRRVGTYTFNGTEQWYQGGSQTSAGMYRYYLVNSIGMKVGTAQDGLCNAFENLGTDFNTTTQEGVFFGYGNELFQFVTATAKTTAELRAIFNSSVTIVFPLATETDITLEENPGWTEYAEIDNFGTVKFNQDPAQDIPVPQAYFVRYTVNLVEFLDSLFVHCGGDVTKLALVEQLQASASE